MSVVICTFNRVDYVGTAIESLRSQTLDADEFEVLVVDNGSTDGTVDAVASIASTVPNVRCMTEEASGLSYARNRGVREAAGDVILFMDDDAIASPRLLEAHLERFRSVDPPLASGGRVRLRWPSSRPRWVPESSEGLYSGLDLGDEARRMHPPEYPYGTNMAIRRDAFDAIGGFSVELGRRGSNLLSGEEKDLFLRLAELEGGIDYVPDALVEHQVLPERVSRRWFLRRSFAQGRSDIVMKDVAHGRIARPRAMARAGLHLGRSVVHGAQAFAALVRRSEQSQVMRSAAASVWWLGASLEGLRSALNRQFIRE